MSSQRACSASQWARLLLAASNARSRRFCHTRHGRARVIEANRQAQPGRVGVATHQLLLQVRDRLHQRVQIIRCHRHKRLAFFRAQRRAAPVTGGRRDSAFGRPRPVVALVQRSARAAANFCELMPALQCVMGVAQWLVEDDEPQSL